MNETPDDGRDLELDVRYRRASAADPSRPGEVVRHAILANAAAQARVHAASRGAWAWRWPAIFGTLAAAALAGLMVLPHIRPAAGPSSPPIVLAPPLPASDIVPPRPAPPSTPMPSAESSLPFAAPSSPSTARLAAARAAPAAPAAPAASAADALPARARAPQPALMSRREAGAQTAPRVAAAATETASARALRRAAEAGDVEATRSLLDAQAPVDARDAQGRSALWLAAFQGHQDLVTLLLARGADPNSADESGVTPRRAAELGGHPQIAAQLRDAGAR